MKSTNAFEESHSIRLWEAFWIWYRFSADTRHPTFCTRFRLQVQARPNWCFVRKCYGSIDLPRHSRLISWVLVAEINWSETGLPSTFLIIAWDERKIQMLFGCSFPWRTSERSYLECGCRQLYRVGLYRRDRLLMLATYLVLERKGIHRDYRSVAYPHESNRQYRGFAASSINKVGVMGFYFRGDTTPKIYVI